MAMDHHVGTENQIKSSGRTTSGLNCRAVSPAPNAFIFYLSILILSFTKAAFMKLIGFGLPVL